MTPEEIQAQLNKKFADVQEELKTLQDSGSATKGEIEAVHKSIEKQGNALEDFMDSQASKVAVSMQQEIKGFLAEKHDEIKAIQKSGSGTIEFVPKAVANITTGSGTDAVTFPAIAHNNLGSMNLRNDEALIGLATVSSTGSPILSYSELEPKDGDYTFVAEGAAKPQVDFKWTNRFATPKKSAAYEILTEESVTDVVRLESVARDYLDKKHGLAKARNLYFGDGTGVNALGATVIGRTFVAGGMAVKVATPNFMDVVNAIVTDIFTTHNYTDEGSYMANTVLVNPVDFFLELVSAKDENGLPLYPQAGLFNSVSIGGITIRPWEKIPAGKIFVADMKQMNVVNYVPFSIRIGWINDQFITNMFTMLGESRYFQYVRKLDEQAFVYDDIATVKTAITKA